MHTEIRTTAAVHRLDELGDGAKPAVPAMKKLVAVVYLGVRVHAAEAVNRVQGK